MAAVTTIPVRSGQLRKDPITRVTWHVLGAANRGDRWHLAAYRNNHTIFVYRDEADVATYEVVTP